MPNFKEHTEQVHHNSIFLDILNDSEGHSKDFSDWFATIGFYTAIHFVEAAIFQRKRLVIKPESGPSLTVDGIEHSEDAMLSYGTGSPHVARRNLIRDNMPVFGRIYNAYGILHEDSRTARYYCHKADSFDSKKTAEKLKLLRETLIEKFPEIRAEIKRLDSLYEVS